MHCLGESAAPLQLSTADMQFKPGCNCHVYSLSTHRPAGYCCDNTFTFGCNTVPSAGCLAHSNIMILFSQLNMILSLSIPGVATTAFCKNLCLSPATCIAGHLPTVCLCVCAWQGAAAPTGVCTSASTSGIPAPQVTWTCGLAVTGDFSCSGAALEFELPLRSEDCPH